MRKTSQNKLINELTEIFATGLAGRPDLQQRLSSILGSAGKNGPAARVETSKQRRARQESMLSDMAVKERMKKQAI